MLPIESEGAGDAVDGAGSDGVDDGLLVLVGTGLQASVLSSLQTVDHGHRGIVAQRCEAVGVILAVLLLISALELGAGALCVVGAEVSVLQLVGGGVAFQTIPAVAAQEGNGQADALGLSQDLAHILIVVGAEDDLRVLAQNGGQLGLEVHVAVGVGLLIDDGAAQALELLDKVLCQALVVVSALQIDDSGLGVAQFLVSVIGHLDALEGVGEGGAEDIRVHGVGLGIVGDSLCGSGSGDHGHIVIGALSRHSQSGRGGDIAHQSGDALIAHLGEAGHSLGGIALLVHGDDLQLLAVDTAVGIDLIQIQGSAVDHGQTVDGNIAGHGAQNADLDGIAGSSRTGCRAGSRSRSGSGRRATAGGQSQSSGRNTGSCQEAATRDLFHTIYPPYVWTISCKAKKQRTFPQSFSASMSLL